MLLSPPPLSFSRLFRRHIFCAAMLIVAASHAFDAVTSPACLLRYAAYAAIIIDMPLAALICW